MSTGFAQVAALCTAAAVGTGCSDDGPPTGPCWPLEATPGGSVEIGTGDIAFEPMPDVLSVVKNASQSDPFLSVHARMRGMPPGDPDDFFNPANPKTKVGAVIEELGITLDIDCPASIGYVPGPEPGTFDLHHSLRVGFGSFPLQDVQGKQALVTVEIVGSNKLYAKAEKLVTLDVPPAPTQVDAGVDAP